MSTGAPGSRLLLAITRARSSTFATRKTRSHTDGRRDILRLDEPVSFVSSGRELISVVWPRGGPLKTKQKGAPFRTLTVMLCAIATVTGDAPIYSQSTELPQAPSSVQNESSENQAAKIPADQLDSLVAPIALYPDPLLAQTLAASTYPLEIIQLQQWLVKNPKLKDKELADAVAKQPWDPSIQAMAGLPDVVKRLADDIQWTTDLGNAFLAQQSDVMDAVQRMRKKAKDKGNLKSSEQQKVETKTVEDKTVIVVEQANPQVVYVPAYNPTVVYGVPVYAYPPIYYPPPGYYAAGMAITFGAGIAMGAMWSGGWGYGCGWGHSNVQINNYNSFNRNASFNRSVSGSRNVSGTRTGTWQHNSQHRGGAPYRDQATAGRYGGTARGESMANREASARQQLSQQGGNLSSRSSGSAAGNRPSGGGADSIGSRDLSRGSGGGSRGAFEGGSGGFNGASARASSSRGASSMGSRGGGSRGGGRRR
jgi:hypothetical protein